LHLVSVLHPPYNIIVTSEGGDWRILGGESSTPDLDDGKTPYEGSARDEISEEYQQNHDEHIKRHHALENAFEQSLVEAAERYMRERDREQSADSDVYDDDSVPSESVWNLADVLTRVATRVIPDGGILQSISETIEFYARHASIRPDGFVYILEAGSNQEVENTASVPGEMCGSVSL
jgi:hypothetical protein